MEMLKKIVIVAILIFWPLNLLINNTFLNFLSYIFPIFQPKFAVFPFLFLILSFKKKYTKLVILSLILIIILWKPFFGQTIFKFDYEAQQQVLQKQKLYPTILTARIFQNKLRIPMGKITENFFALTDPNNYFFGFAPRQIIIDNQNLKKFPFLSLPFLLIGAFYLKTSKNYKLILTLLIACLANLSILKLFDRNDFILWLPLSLIIIHGLNIFDKKLKNKTNLYYLLFLLFVIPEILRIIIK